MWSGISVLCLGLSRRTGAYTLPGIPFNDTTDLRLGIAEAGEAILGDKLVGFQVGNEPDQYAKCVSFLALKSSTSINGI